MALTEMMNKIFAGNAYVGKNSYGYRFVVNNKTIGICRIMLF